MRHLLSMLPFSLLLTVCPVRAADIGAGKSTAQAECGACHEPTDWEGETPASLESLMKDIVRGKVKHPKKQLRLNDQEIANIAAYWSRNKK